MAELRFTLLGTGSSGGVPRLSDRPGGAWGACDPNNPRNRRRRCSMLVERVTAAGTTRVLIDTSPDLREQLISAGVGRLDAVVFTHPHADHIHGIDDLRLIVFNMRKRLPVWADAPTAADLLARFSYVFTQPEGSSYPPILELNRIEGPVRISGAGGAVTLNPFVVGHGRIDSLGFRIGGLAYLPDVAEMYPEAWAAVENLDIWVLDALRREPHPTHTHLAQSLEWIARAAPKRGVLTNMHIDLDYATLEAETPDHVSVAYDGMVLCLPDSAQSGDPKGAIQAEGTFPDTGAEATGAKAAGAKATGAKAAGGAPSDQETAPAETARAETARGPTSGTGTAPAAPTASPQAPAKTPTPVSETGPPPRPAAEKPD